jgi:hypothetical protein
VDHLGKVSFEFLYLGLFGKNAFWADGRNLTKDKVFEGTSNKTGLNPKYFFTNNAFGKTPDSNVLLILLIRTDFETFLVLLSLILLNLSVTFELFGKKRL